MYEYKEIVNFCNNIDALCGTILSTENINRKRLDSLQSENNKLRRNMGALQEIIRRTAANVNPKYGSINYFAIISEMKNINIAEMMKNYDSAMSEADRANICVAGLTYDIPAAEKIINECQACISTIETHDDFKKWVKNCRKYLEKNKLPSSPPNGMSRLLIDHSLADILDIMQEGTAFMRSDDSKLRSAYLYKVYMDTLGASDSKAPRASFLEQTENRLQALKNNLNFFAKFRYDLYQAANALFQKLKEELQENESELYKFPDVSDQMLKSKVNEAYDEICNSIDSAALRTQLYTLYNSFIDWHSCKLKETSDEKYIFSYHKGFIQNLADESPYIESLRKSLLTEFDCLIKDEYGDMVYFFPEVININSSSFNYIIDAQNMCTKEDKIMINSLVQNFVASTIANFPTGKTKFLFCDPDNTGVFSIFRDIGKIIDDVDESNSCEYAGSQDSISRKLDNICTEISEVVNKIIKGTETTLYDHNRDNEFNSLPYKFIMLMDFPRKMTAISLEALRSILKNGPRCGIFTVLVNISGEAMDLLGEAERKIASEIIREPAFTLKNQYIYDTCGNLFGEFTEELQAGELDQFTAVYNERAKNDVQIILDIDSLENKEVACGGYSIPIGRSKGGKIEYLAFFDHCQNYLLSGAIGRGKSNALHVMIHNSLKYIKYLDLYLIDFKHGVEFAPYARLNHPAFKVLAIESVPEFGYSVLLHITDKIARISEIYRENGVENWNELYNKTGKIIPATLIVMDEFQHLFEGSHGKQCSEIIEYIAKEGRVFNVHLVLSSQTVNNLSGLTEAAKQMIFGRIVFYNDELEYRSMLWDDDSIAKTLNQDVKGQAILATSKENQKFVQFAKKKNIEDSIQELSLPLEKFPNRTKIMLSAVHENPYSVYNIFMRGKYSPNEFCDLIIGDDVFVEASNIKEYVEDPDYKPTARPDEVRLIRLKNRPNDNVLILGNNERKAETLFMFSLICTLMKQITAKKFGSISLIMVTTAADLYNLAMKFPKFIKIYDTSDMLTNAVDENTEYLFVFGLHGFSSMKFNEKAGTSNADGEMFRQALDGSRCNVIVWHNDIENLANMFGGNEAFPEFNKKFLHKIGMNMTAEDSEMFIESDKCSSVSSSAVVYKFHNTCKILRIYNRFEPKYLNKLIDKLNE